MKTLIGLLLSTLALNVFCAEIPVSPYIPVKGSAWRLAAADVNGDEKNEIVYSARDGAIRCVNPDNGDLLWDVPLGGFAYELRTADINDDGKPEFIAPCADGILYVISHKGKVLWTFKAGLQLLDAVVAFPKRDHDKPMIICTGIDQQIYMLEAEGKLKGQIKVSRSYASRLATGDLGGNGKDKLLAVVDRNTLAAYEIKSSGLQLIQEVDLKSDMINWENGGGDFYAFSVSCADLDEDGKDDVVMGESLWSRQPVMALNPSLSRRWISGALKADSPGFEYYSEAIVRPTNLRPKLAGLETLALAGRNFRLFSATGELLEEFGCPLGFTDLLIDGDTLWLGSSPNGDETIYRIDLSKDWKAQIQLLERHGVSKRIGESIAELRKQVFAYHGAPPEGGPEYDLRIFNVISPETYHLSFPDITGPGSLTDTIRWFNRQFSEYSNLKAVGLVDLIEDKPVYGTDGALFKPGHTHAQPLPKEKLVQFIEAYETNRIPVMLNFAHGSRPQITLKTAEAMLKAGPTYFNGFICTETDDYPGMLPFYETYFGPLADLCAEYGKKKCVTHNKNVWWMSIPSQKKMFNILFNGDRSSVLTAGVEDSASNSAELNLMARMGLRQAGLIAHLQSTAILDLFTATRFHEWEYPQHGHPFLRLLAAQTLMGGDTFHMRIEHLNPDGFTQDGRESTEIIFNMLGKGLLMAPKPENMAGLSTLGIAVHDVPQKWINEAHNRHRPQYWLEIADQELENAVIPHNGVTWGDTATPEHALQHILFNKTEQSGQIPSTPYGPVVIVPARADLSKVAGVKEWWHTDGICLWREGGKKLTGKEAADALKISFEKAAENLPFRPFGDDVFFHTVRMDDNTYRIYAVDPGWLSPQDRHVNMRIQLEGNFTVRDLLSGDSLEIKNRSVEFTVPAGCLRIFEAKRI